MNQESTSFETDCFHCHTGYDIFEALWCECIVRESSLVCPSCRLCFCKAPPSFKAGYWQKAPSRLRLARIRDFRKDGDRIVQPAAVVAASDSPLVLVVDDSRAVRAAARVTLEDAGYRVAEAADALQGLRLIHETKPALVLSDALMPGMDGREMCRIVKNDPRTSTIKVVLMTGLYTAARYKAEALSAFRADEYIAKPVTAERLRQLVATLLFGQDLQSPSAEVAQRNAA